MFFNELKKYFKSKLNIILAILLTLPVILSYVSTNIERNEWTQQLKSASPDLNIFKTQKLVDGYNGLSYLYNFLFSTDYLVIFFLILLIGFSCICGIQLFNHKKSGFGNYIVSRTQYSTYLNSVLLAQLIYIIIYMMLYFTLLVIITHIFFPIAFSENITSSLSFDTYTAKKSIMILFFQIVLITILVISIIAVTTLSNVFISNKYLICFLPIAIYFVPFIACTICENISYSFANILAKFVFDSNLLTIYFYSITEMSPKEFVLSYISTPLILIIMSIVLYIFNIKKYKESYL